MYIQKPRETDGVHTVSPEINLDILSKNITAGQSLLKKPTTIFCRILWRSIYCSSGTDSSFLQRQVAPQGSLLRADRLLQKCELILFGLNILIVFNCLEERIYMVLKMKITFLPSPPGLLYIGKRNKNPPNPPNLHTQVLVQHYPSAGPILGGSRRMTPATCGSSVVPKEAG